VTFITNIVDLDALYPDVIAASISKVADHLTAQYSAWLDAARFCVLSTAGPSGTDGTPRGDTGSVVVQLDVKTLLLPDWAGNNRLDSLRNIVVNPHVSLLFMVPGSKNVVRVNGRAQITTDPKMRARFQRRGTQPRTVLLVAIDEVYFQCAKAIMRAELWGDQPRPDIPTAGDFLVEMTNGASGGKDYDAGYDARAQKQLWSRAD